MHEVQKMKGNKEENLKEPLTVSVVIPVYNVEAYLPQCIESVVGQTYRDIEIILVDDGSTDGSGKICDEYAARDSRIQVIHTENRGLSAARNKGVETSRSDYLSFLDSDDWMEPNAIETLLDTAMRFDADVVVSRFCREFIGRSEQLKTDFKEIRTLKNEEILSVFSTGEMTNLTWNKLYRSNRFQPYSFPEGRTYEDVSIIWKIMKDLSDSDGTVVVIPDVLFHYRMQKSSIVHTPSMKNAVDNWTAHQEKFNGLPNYHKHFFPDNIGSISKMLRYYSAFSKSEKKAAKPVVKEMRKFSKTYFYEIMRGDYFKRTKLVCFISLFISPPVMFACHCTWKLICLIRKPDADCYG